MSKYYEAELLSALRWCVESLAGYRREQDDRQPCDAETNALRILTRESDRARRVKADNDAA
jgi:hypothetical protein